MGFAMTLGRIERLQIMLTEALTIGASGDECRAERLLFASYSSADWPQRDLCSPTKM
jgi:hypothetical protein